ncbi:hypothetical protein M0804_005117 [Polistes exclamans]|nr:hypothetical protein M0804_005117 [Polistes exclamans]
MAEFQVVLCDGDDGLIGPILLLLFGCTMTSFYTTLRAFVLTDRENIMPNSYPSPPPPPSPPPLPPPPHEGVFGGARLRGRKYWENDKHDDEDDDDDDEC